jgi:uncharacterized protein
MFDLIAAFTIGFIGSVHCLGMCGPLVLAYSLHIKDRGTCAMGHAVRPWESGLLHHLLFHSGRLFSYGFIGALAAGVFQGVSLSRFFPNLRGGVTLVGGGLMVFLGFALLKVLPLPDFFPSLRSGTPPFWRRLLPSLLRSQRLGSRMALGFVAGFLPCGLSWSMIVKAATAQTFAGGFLTMVSFGLGTVPALYLIGFSASLLSLRTRIIGEKIAALSVIAMGLILVFKGVRTFV